MKVFISLLIGVIWFQILGTNPVFAGNWEWVFDQTKIYPECVRIQKVILKEFWNSIWFSAEQSCSLYMMWYEWINWKFQETAYSTYAKVISLKKWVIRIQYSDRYSINTIEDIVVENYIIPKNILQKTFVINLMYNNDIDLWDYFIDWDSVYIIYSWKFIWLDIKKPNSYCVKIYGKWYKYHLLSHSCKK